MKKIVHLSDLHIGYKNMSDVFEGMIGRLIYLCKPANEYVVVITGDLIDDATKEGQLTEAKSHIETIKQEGFNLLVAPGNHDYGSENSATDERMKRYKQEIYGDANAKFPRFDPIGGVAFIGLDSMEGEIKKNQGAWADGEIGEEQLTRLDNLLSSQAVVNCQYTVVYLHHHPIDESSFFRRVIREFHGLDDAKELKGVLAAHEIDALLFGHNHDGRQWNGNWGIKRAYDAGSSTGKGDTQGPHRVIDLAEPLYTDFDAQL